MQPNRSARQFHTGQRVATPADGVGVVTGFVWADGEWAYNVTIANWTGRWAERELVATYRSDRLGCVTIPEE